MGDLVKKHNQVVRASYRLSPFEQAIVLTALTHIPPDENVTDQKMYQLRVEDLSRISGSRQDNAYRDFKKASLELFDRKLTICNGSKKLTRWVQTIEYKDGEGFLAIKFSNEILPYLTNLKDNFTTYNLQHVAKFKSTYGVRIYELIKQWCNTKKCIEISIQEIKEMFQLDNKYSRTDVLKKRVIESALRDINNHSDLYVKYENIKEGRRIVGFKFVFKDKKTTKEQIEKYARPGESWQDAKKRLSEKN